MRDPEKFLFDRLFFEVLKTKNGTFRCPGKGCSLDTPILPQLLLGSLRILDR